MKFTINNGAMVELNGVFNKFQNVSGKLGYALSRARSSFTNELKAFNEVRDTLIKKYGTDDGNGNIEIDQDSENFKKFIEEITPILDIKVEVDIMQVTREEFENTDIYNEKCTMSDYNVIEQIFVKKDDIEEKNGDDTNE